jgi:hypothetical protein
MNINRWNFQIPLLDVKTFDGDTSLENCCILCGKKIKGSKYLVHLLNNGNLISTDQNLAESQGFFPIGSECRNSLPNNFYWKSI